MTELTIEDAARAACLEIGVEYKPVPQDGLFHAVNLIDDHRGKGDGRIKIFPDGQGGIVCNWKSGKQRTFFINGGNSSVSMTDEERARIKAEQEKRKRETKAKQNKAASKAQAIWKAAKPAPANHPYLTKKQVNPYGVRVADWEKRVLDDGQWNKIVVKNSLLVPLFNSSGVLRNLQAIFPENHPELDRNKDFLPGAELAGLFWWVGAKTETVCICEGFATAVTVHGETGWRSYVSFTANNLLSVGKTIREHLPEAKIIFCADHDKSTGNPGLTKANEAASEVGGLVAVPPIAGMDFNDYHLHIQGAL